MKFADVIQSADWKLEKHVPVIEAPEVVKVGDKVIVKVSVGKEIGHPNTTEHYIKWIKLFFRPEGGKFASELGSFEFSAHGESTEGPNKGPAYSDPSVVVTAKLTVSGTLLALAYCNIHGLWEDAKTIKIEE